MVIQMFCDFCPTEKVVQKFPKIIVGTLGYVMYLEIFWNNVLNTGSLILLI